MLHNPCRKESTDESTSKNPNVIPDPTHITPLVCDHTLHLSDANGTPTGSWSANSTRDGIYYSCACCGKLYGYQPNKKSDAEMYQAYLEQQRRLACPGCGEEPFMG